MVPSFAKQFILATATIQLAVATTTKELAQDCKVPVSLLHDVLNTTDYAAIDITQYADLFQQPVEVIQTWTDEVKQEALANFAHEVELFSAPPGEVDDIIAARNVDGSHLYLGHQERTLSLHNARIRSAQSGCFQNIACGGCVTAAGLLATSGIIGCVGTAMTAEAITVTPTFGSSTAPIWLAMVGCITRVSSVGAGGITVCHSALKA